MKRWTFLLVLALTVGLQGQSARAADDPPGRIGRLVEARGTVWLYEPETAQWQAIPANRPLTAGDRLATERDARAELRIGSITLRLDGDSHMEFRRLDDDRVEVLLHGGSLALRVYSPEVARELEVVTAEGAFHPQQPGHYRIDRRDESSHVTVWRGDMRFDGTDSSLLIPTGQHAELWLQGAQRSTHYTWRDVLGDDFAAWAARDAAEPQRSISARYVSPEMTGWEDLDRHGQWTSDAEHGALWIPRGVALDWAPYRHGHWRWMAPWGWTWIDDARWGFAPFHYGRWVHAGGRWCWAPGRHVARPVYAPALVSWVSLPGVSIGVQVGGRPAPQVAWVPLAPREVYRPGYGGSAHHIHELNRPHGSDADYNVTRERVPMPVANLPHAPGRNLGAPGAVTTVQGEVFFGRRPVAAAALPDSVDPRARQGLTLQHQPPTAPARPIVAAQPLPATPAAAAALPPASPSRERAPMPGVRVPVTVQTPSAVAPPAAQAPATPPGAAPAVAAPSPLPPGPPLGLPRAAAPQPAALPAPLPHAPATHAPPPQAPAPQVPRAAPGALPPANPSIAPTGPSVSPRHPPAAAAADKPGPPKAAPGSDKPLPTPEKAPREHKPDDAKVKPPARGNSEERAKIQ